MDHDNLSSPNTPGHVALHPKPLSQQQSLFMMFLGNNVKHQGSGLIDTEAKGVLGPDVQLETLGREKFKLPIRISVTLDSNETRTTQVTLLIVLYSC